MRFPASRKGRAQHDGEDRRQGSRCIIGTEVVEDVGGPLLCGSLTQGGQSVPAIFNTDQGSEFMGEAWMGNVGGGQSAGE